MILRTFCRRVMEDQSIRGPSIPHIWNKDVVLTLALAFERILDADVRSGGVRREKNSRKQLRRPPTLQKSEMMM